MKGGGKMNTQLKNLMYVILQKYDGTLYNSALTKLVYLVDITSLYRYGKQVTDIEWKRDNFGPYVWDILNCAYANTNLFRVIGFVDNKKRIELIEGGDCGIDPNTVDVLENIFDTAPNPNFSFNAFVEYVYSTPPMLLSKRLGDLNAKEIMNEVREIDEFTNELFSDPEWNEAFEYLAAN